MKTRYKIFLLLLVSTGLGCQKYVDIQTKGQLSPTETSNYRYIMNNGNIVNVGMAYSDYSSDDVDLVDKAQQDALFAPINNMYIWAEKNYDPANRDVSWDGMYNIIFSANTVIAGVLNSTNGTDAEKNQIYGEALVHRAYAYLSLVREYGKGYASASATDLGVPILLTPEVEAQPARATVRENYAQIIADLKKSVPLMSPLNKFNTLASKASAYAILARTYLDMSDYNNARLYADSTLAIKSSILNLNTVNNAITRNIDNPELILSKNANIGTGFTPLLLRLSDDMLSLFSTTDLRYSIYTANASTVSANYTGRVYIVDARLAFPEYRNNGPTVPEMMLIKAECLARNNDANGAMALVNQIRVNRFAPANYVPLTATSADDALVKVLQERRRETFCKGLRWADLKRLNNETKFAKTITRVFKGTTYTLAPNSNRYAYPIGDYYFKFNSNLVQNPR